jgi:hypothetical protein
VSIKDEEEEGEEEEEEEAGEVAKLKLPIGHCKLFRHRVTKAKPETRIVAQVKTMVFSLNSLVYSSFKEHQI